MKKRAIIWDFIKITVATAIVAASVYFFLIPSNLTIASISGLAIVLSEVLPLQMSVINLILNCVLLVIGLLLIGKEFGLKTIYTSLLMPVFLGVLEYFLPNQASLTGDQFVDMIAYILAVSAGLAILFSCNASSGGLDIVAKLLNKYLHMDLGVAMSAAGMCTTLSALFVYDIKTVIISVIGTYLNGIVLDHFIFGLAIKKRVCIVSNELEKIKNFLLEELHSGASIYRSTGAYTGEERNEIIAIVDRNEYRKLMDFIAQVDSNAFVTVYNVNKIIYRPKPHR